MLSLNHLEPIKIHEKNCEQMVFAALRLLNQTTTAIDEQQPVWQAR